MPSDADDRRGRTRRGRAGKAPPAVPDVLPVSPDTAATPRKPRKALRERSAGVLVFRDAAAPDGTIRREFLLLDYGRHWDYPKGHLEAGETDRQAALRELREETGLSEGVTLIDGFAKQIVYHFQSSRKGLVRKEVVFFVARLEPGERPVILSEEHVGYVWLPRAEALARLTFDNARGVLAAGDNFVATLDLG